MVKNGELTVYCSTKRWWWVPPWSAFSPCLMRWRGISVECCGLKWRGRDEARRGDGAWPWIPVLTCSALHWKVRRSSSPVYSYVWFNFKYVWTVLSTLRPQNPDPFLYRQVSIPPFLTLMSSFHPAWLKRCGRRRVWIKKKKKSSLCSDSLSFTPQQSALLVESRTITWAVTPSHVTPPF